MPQLDPEAPEVKSNFGFTTAIRIDHGIAVGVVSGSIDLEGLKRNTESVWRSSEWLGRAILWDMRDSHFDLSRSEIEDLTSFILHYQPDPPPRRVALVFKTDLEFGLGRVLQAFRERPGTELEVFREIEAAREWVGDA